MGQQQLLLIILGVIVVGIAVAVGITMFTDSATSANRDAITNDLVNLSSRAQQYYRRPKSLAGGGNTFTGLTMGQLSNAAGSNSSFTNANGSYVLSSATGSSVQLVAYGTEKNGSGNTVQVQMNVSATKIDTTMILQ